MGQFGTSVFCQVDVRTEREHPYLDDPGELLKHSISYALIRARKIVRGLSQSLTQADQLAVATAAVDELRRHGHQWQLDDEVMPKGEVHSTPKEY